jgi:hypothetical protein
MKKYYLVLGFTLMAVLNLFFGSCKTKKVKSGDASPIPIEKELISNNASEVFFNKIIAHKNSTNEISYSAEADYKDSKQSVSLNMEILAKRNQYIFLNAKAFGLVNVARVMIKQDSIRILDLINRKYISASYRFMEGYSSAPIGFEQLQNLVWANAIFDPKVGSTSIDSLGQYLILLLDMGNTKQKATYSKSLFTQSVVLTEQGKTQEMQVNYSDFKEVDGINYPHNILINIQAEKNVECKFSISNFAGSIKKEPQFAVPKSYKVQVF